MGITYLLQIKYFNKGFLRNYFSIKSLK